VPHAYPGKRVRRLSRWRRRWQRRNLPSQIRQSAQRLGGYERSPLVISHLDEIGAAGPLRRTKLFQKIRVQAGLIARKQEQGDPPPRGRLAGVEYFDSFIPQQIQ
jgi:hypothetical protein